MDVLLLQDVDNLGLAGDAVKVKPGYARNFLIPQRLAMLATSGALKQAEAIRKSGEIRRAQEKADAEAIVNQIEGVLLVFERRAGDRGQLYGSVTVAEIAAALSEKVSIEIDRRKIRLPEPLRSLGDYEVTVRLMVEVSTTIQVAVIQEGETYISPSDRPDDVVEAGEEVVAEDAIAEEAATEAVIAEVEVDEAVAEAETEADV